MRVAALDLGSNTFLCLIADIRENGEIEVVRDMAEVVRLGQGIAATGAISSVALQRAAVCLERYEAEIRALRPERVLAVATAAARTASNGLELLQLTKKLSLPTEIISGEQEAEFTYQGVSSSKSGFRPVLVIDIGGGSTELIYGINSVIKSKKSFEIGVVKLKEKFIQRFPVTSDTENLIREEIERTFLGTNSFHVPDASFDVVAVAGTPTTLAAAVLGGFDAKKIEGFHFSLKDLKEWQRKLRLMKPEEIQEQFNVPAGRADVLCVGVMILIGVLEFLKKEALTVSVRGLRYGLAAHLAKSGEK